jgi:hypothetical protein
MGSAGKEFKQERINSFKMPGKNQKSENEKLLAERKIEMVTSIKAELDSGGSLKSARLKLLQIYSKGLVDEAIESFKKDAIRKESSEMLSKYGDPASQTTEIDFSYFGPTIESVIVAGAAITIALLIVYLLLFVILAVFVGK